MRRADNGCFESKDDRDAVSQIYWSLNNYREIYTDLVDLVNIAVETDYTPFTFDPQKTYPTRTPVADTKRKHLGGFLPKFDLSMDLFWPGYYYSPDMRLFFDVLSSHPIARLRKADSSRTVSAMKWQAELYNQFIADLREEGIRRNVKKQLSDWRGGLTEQAHSIREQLVAIRAFNKGLLPLRVDMYYGATAAVEADAMPRSCWGAYSRALHADDHFDASGWVGGFEVRARIDPARAMQDRASFFENRKGADRELFDAMLAYLCKMEVGGRHRANHFHVLFLFDAERVRQYQLDHMLGLVTDRWQRLTGGLGLVFNCRGRSDEALLRSQGRWALDPIDPVNDGQWGRLGQYLKTYFAKDDGQILRVKPTPKAHTLTMGQV